MSNADTKRPIHPEANKFPMMEGAQYEEFREDIRRHGLMTPIAVMPDGCVLDGRNRLKACLEVGVEPRFLTVNPESPMAYVMSANKHRRHLSSSQLAAYGPEVVESLRPEAQERQREAGGGSGRRGGDKRTVVQPFGQPFADSEEPKKPRTPPTVAKAAKLLGTNSDYVQKAIAMKQESPDLLEKVKKGDLSIPDAYSEHAARTGKRAQIRENAARNRVAEFVGRIEGIPGCCEKVTVEAIRSDERLLRHWREASKNAINALRSLLKKLED